MPNAQNNARGPATLKIQQAWRDRQRRKTQQNLADKAMTQDWRQVLAYRHGNTLNSVTKRYQNQSLIAARNGWSMRPLRAAHRAATTHFASKEMERIYRLGMDKGYALGYEQAYDLGHRVGHQLGRQVGYGEGHGQGRRQGYEDLYSDRAAKVGRVLRRVAGGFKKAMRRSNDW